MQEEQNAQQSFGAQVRAWRKERKMTQAELATKVNIDQSFISKLECGYRVYTTVKRAVVEFTGIQAA